MHPDEELDQMENPKEPEKRSRKTKKLDPADTELPEASTEKDPLGMVRKTLEEPSPEPQKKAPFTRRFLDWLKESSDDAAQPLEASKLETLSDRKMQDEGINDPTVSESGLKEPEGLPDDEADTGAQDQEDLKQVYDLDLDALDFEEYSEESEIILKNESLQSDQPGKEPAAGSEEEAVPPKPFLAFLYDRDSGQQLKDQLSDEELERRLASAKLETDALGEPVITPQDEAALEDAGFLINGDQEMEQGDLEFEQDDLGDPLLFAASEQFIEQSEFIAEDESIEEPLPESEMPDSSEEHLAPIDSAGEPPPVDYQQLREMALEDYVEPVEPPSKPSLSNQAASWWRSLSLFQRGSLIGLVIINLALLTLGIILALRTAVMVFLPAQGAAPTPLPTSEVPFPVEVRLPGGWPIGLNPATILDGEWKPAEPEWLQGTEIRRWIAIPWSKELEAVFQSILPGDLVVLKMNNRDEWEYTVREIRQVPAGDLPGFSQNEPSVLIFLSDDRSDTRWVLIAVR